MLSRIFFALLLFGFSFAQGYAQTEKPFTLTTSVGLRYPKLVENGDEPYKGLIGAPLFTLCWKEKVCGGFTYIAGFKDRPGELRSEADWILALQSKKFGSLTVQYNDLAPEFTDEKPKVIQMIYDLRRTGEWGKHAFTRYGEVEGLYMTRDATRNSGAFFRVGGTYEFKLRSWLGTGMDANVFYGTPVFAGPQGGLVNLSPFANFHFGWCECDFQAGTRLAVPYGPRSVNGPRLSFGVAVSRTIRF